MRQQRGIHLLNGILGRVALPGESQQINFPIPERRKSKEQGKEDNLVSAQGSAKDSREGYESLAGTSQPRWICIQPVLVACR